MAKQEKLNEFERHIIKLATQQYLEGWKDQLIEDEKQGKRGLFAPSYPDLVYMELERKLTLQEV
jgi:hypothetical protein